MPIIAIVSVIASPHYKRIGDYAAGTTIVKEKAAEASEGDFSYTKFIEEMLHKHGAEL